MELKDGCPVADIVAGRIRHMIQVANPDSHKWNRDFERTAVGEPNVRVRWFKYERRRGYYEASVYDQAHDSYCFCYQGYTYAELLQAALHGLRDEIEHRWKWRGVDDDEFNGYPKTVATKPQIEDREGRLA